MEKELSLNEKLLESHIIEVQKKLNKEKIFFQCEKKSYEYYLYLYFPSKENNNKKIELLLLINLVKNRI